jgi:hypothetical protein
VFGAEGRRGLRIENGSLGRRAARGDDPPPPESGSQVGAQSPPTPSRWPR